MPSKKIPKRVSTALLQSLAAGVVPRSGLEYIAVGRKSEIDALLDDLDNIIADGGATFRLILGRYGSGKSFLCQLIRNYAVQKNFVVADADLNPTRRLTGAQGQGLSLYRELLNNLATRARPDGNAFAAVLERWISDIQNEVIQKQGISPSAPNFSGLVEQRIYSTVNQMENLVHGFDFASVINAYWQGHLSADDTRKGAALRWLRGEYSTKTEARHALDVRVIIDDDTWYDYVKLLAQFVQNIGYKGLVIFIDEGVNLYKIANTVSRNHNYERLLSIYNDTLQGKAEYLGVVFGGTPQMVEDRQRGLFSYEALRSRLEESRFARDGLRDLSGPLIRLNVLTNEEIYLLLQHLRGIHALQYGYEPQVTDDELRLFMTEIANRLGADQMLTPREVVRDFITILNLLHQNPGQTLPAIIGRPDFQPSHQTYDPDTLSPETEIRDDEPDKQSPYAGFDV